MSELKAPTAASKSRSAMTGLERCIVRARLSLAWEAMWLALWPPLGIAGTFLSAAFLDLFAFLPGWLHALVLAAFAILFGSTLYQGGRYLIWPDRTAALRRIEKASGLEHRPLEALQDRLPKGVDDPTTRALWAAHQRQMADLVRALKVGTPAPGLSSRDPWAVRIAVVLLLFVGVFVAGADTPHRLAQAFAPQFDKASRTRAAKLELWVTPPEYTRLPPIFPIQIARDRVAALKQNSDRPESEELAPKTVELEIEIPEGSTLTAIVSGGDGAAALDINGKTTPFEALDAINRRLQVPVAESGRVSVVLDGKTLGSWKVRARRDNPPTIALDGAPAPTQRGTLRLAYTGADDYGITEIRGEMRRTYERGDVIGKEVSKFELPTPSLNTREIKEATFQEIAPHPWAGLPVVIRLAAKDAAGHESFSEEIKMILPERDFTNPIAKRIIEERRKLTTMPERRGEVIRSMNEIAGQPGVFKDDTVVFMGLIFSRSRLFHEEEDSAIPPVRELMWDTALRVEDGQLSHVERDLLRAQEALMRALDRITSDAELERLIRELQNAMNRYSRELTRKLQESSQTEAVMPMDPTTSIMRTADFKRMIEQIRDMMRAGARDAARQMLSQLSNMLESLRNARMMRGNPQNQRATRRFASCRR